LGLRWRLFKGRLCSIFISINNVFIYTILSIIKKKNIINMFVYKNHCVFMHGRWSDFQPQLHELQNQRHLFNHLTLCDVTSAYSSVNLFSVLLYVLSSRKPLKMLSSCALNCLRTESTNPGYSFFMLPWDNKFKLDSW